MVHGGPCMFLELTGKGMEGGGGGGWRSKEQVMRSADFSWENGDAMKGLQ